MNDRINELEVRLEAIAFNDEIEKINLMNQLAWELRYRDTDRSEALSCEAYKMSELLNYEQGIARGLLFNGFLFGLKNSYIDALENLYTALEKFEELQDYDGLVKSYNALGISYFHIGKHNEAIDTYLIGLRIAKENIAPGIIYMLNNISEVYKYLGRHEERLNCLLEALNYDLEDDAIIGGAILSNISECYADNGDPHLAMHYCKKALELSAKAKTLIVDGSIQRVMGKIHIKLNQFDKANECYTNAIEVFGKIGEKYYYNETLYDIGKMYFTTENFDKAIEYLNRSMEICEEVSSYFLLNDIHMMLARIYEKKSLYKESIEHYKKHIEISEQVAIQELERKLTNFTINNRIEESKKDAEIYRLKNVELKRKTIELEETTNELNEALIELQNTQMHLIQSEKMAAIGQMVAGVAHEVNTPLAVIKSNLEMEKTMLAILKDSMREAGFDSEGIKEYCINAESMSDVNEIALERMVALARGLKNFSRIDEAEVKEVDIHDGLDNTLILVNNQLGKNIKMIKDYGQIPLVTCFPQQLNQVFLNLLINAIHAIKDTGEVTIKTYADNKNVYISISDTGVGIHKENLSKIFDPGFTTKGVGVGTGLGLSISYNIIMKHKGKLLVTSEVGKGTTFQIVLPIILEGEL